MPNFTNMIGKKLATVVLSDGKQKIDFYFTDGSNRSFAVEGDCCSRSWIEHLEMPGHIQGATLLSVANSGVTYDENNIPSTTGITQDHPEHDEENGGDYISVYNTAFRTDRGDIVLEYRNSSNGYYGGYLVDA